MRILHRLHAIVGGSKILSANSNIKCRGHSGGGKPGDAKKGDNEAIFVVYGWDADVEEEGGENDEGDGEDVDSACEGSAMTNGNSYDHRWYWAPHCHIIRRLHSTHLKARLVLSRRQVSKVYEDISSEQDELYDTTPTCSQNRGKRESQI